MEPIRIEHDGIKKAIQSGHSYIQIGKRKFLLMEVEDASDSDCYEVTDPDEEEQLLAALNDNNPLLTDEEIKAMLES
ncbi:hypothetical protein EJF36_19260 [Bacillus sp. HMF5848]|uniref:hypothetical protein n=1 Tax=Bacillus sp. HMF5848 TaxID=2495421 RepID=UPI000F7779DF|nr:hypothetical protein [Bacillus sp. HMF5848]RSK28841.1 hypothetical protein EJF36_19260 [Bacillus sp. HMF5848]